VSPKWRVESGDTFRFRSIQNPEEAAGLSLMQSLENSAQNGAVEADTERALFQRPLRHFWECSSLIEWYRRATKANVLVGRMETGKNL
jgi:hypothetical protein